MIWWVLAVTVARLVAAALMPLSADEAYYRVWAHALAPGYLDHPPMVALWIAAGTALAGDTALGVRLLGPLSAAAGTLLLAGAARDLAGDRAAGDRAALALNATLALNAGAVIMTPDTPLLFFWSAALAAVARAARGGGAWFLAAGAAAGLALASKYTAILLAPALLAWMLAAPPARRWLRAWQPPAGAAVALLIFAPVLAWNAAHGWASFAKQGGRAFAIDPARSLRFLGELLGGQLGLATPLLAAVFCLAVWRAARRWREPGPALAAATVLVPGAVFLLHALGGDRVQANWPGVLYPGAALAAGLTMSRLWTPAVALGAAMSALVVVQAAVAPLALPRRLDFALIRLGGWDALGRDAAAAARAERLGCLVADEYGLAAELAFTQDLPVAGAEPRWALFALPEARLGPCLLVRSLRRAAAPDPALFPGALRLPAELTRGRNGVVAERYALWRVPAAAPARATGAVALPGRGP